MSARWTSWGAVRRGTAWSAVRRALIAVGMVLGTINTAILLTVVYIVFVPWMRLGYSLAGRDILGRRMFRERRSSWVVLEGSARAPTAADLEDQF